MTDTTPPPAQPAAVVAANEQYLNPPADTETRQVVSAEDAARVGNSPAAAMFRAEEAYRADLLGFIYRNLKPGHDYGEIELKDKDGNFKGKTKPSLFKSGAEKLMRANHARASFTVDEETRGLLGNPTNVLAYICYLYDEDDGIIGEGRGACKIDGRRDENNAIKIAQKRAQVDAVLRTWALSEIFTQDLEDYRQQEDLPRTAQNTGKPAGTTTASQTRTRRQDPPAGQQQATNGSQPRQARPQGERPAQATTAVQPRQPTPIDSRRPPAAAQPAAAQQATGAAPAKAPVPAELKEARNKFLTLARKFPEYANTEAGNAALGGWIMQMCKTEYSKVTIGQFTGMTRQLESRANREEQIRKQQAGALPAVDAATAEANQMFEDM